MSFQEKHHRDYLHIFLFLMYKCNLTMTKNKTFMEIRNIVGIIFFFFWKGVRAKARLIPGNLEAKHGPT